MTQKIDYLGDVLSELEREDARIRATPKVEKATKNTKGHTTKVVPEETAKIDPESLAPSHAVFKTSKAHQQVARIEKRFLEVAGLTGDLEHFPIDQSNHLQVRTNKSKSDQHGEVFTPLWLVDQMIERVSDASLRDQGKTFRDLCAGYGQFTVRLLRKKVGLLGERFDVQDFLANCHSFVELQPNSCYRLLYIFGTKISLAIGDASLLGRLPDSAEGGIWVWCAASEEWKDMTDRVTKKFNDLRNKGANHGIEKQAEQFEEWFNELQERMQARRERG